MQIKPEEKSFAIKAITSGFVVGMVIAAVMLPSVVLNAIFRR